MFRRSRLHGRGELVSAYRPSSLEIVQSGIAYVMLFSEKPVVQVVMKQIAPFSA